MSMRKDTQVKTLRASSSQTDGTETGTVANGGLLVYTKVFTHGVFVLDITLLAADADDTMDVYVDVSFDGGLSWVNVVHFVQILGNGSAAKYVAVVSIDPSVEELYTVTADLAAGNTRQLGLGTQMRFRGVVVDGATADAAFTYSLVAFLF